MTKEQKTKLNMLECFLTSNGITYYRSFVSKKRDIKAELYIPQHKILVKVSEGEEKDNVFYKAVKYGFHPLFIRDNESKDFVLEKMQNLLIDLMKQSQKNYIKKNRA